MWPYRCRACLLVLLASVGIEVFCVSGADMLPLSVSSPSTGVLDIVWGTAAGAGAPVSPSCVFSAWEVEVLEVAESSIVNSSVCTPANPEASGHHCQLTGLATNSMHRVSVQEDCVNGTTFRNASVAYTVTYPSPGVPPTDISLVEAGHQWLTIRWDASVNAGDCIFQDWHVEIRHHDLGGSWVSQASCQGMGTRDTSNCTVIGLHRNAPYEVRIKELCTDSRANSAFSSASLPLYTALLPASVPTTIHLVSADYEQLTFSWVPGSDAGDCVFQSWLVRWRSIRNGTWVSGPDCSVDLSSGNATNSTTCIGMDIECSGSDRTSTTCNITGLVRLTSYEVKIQETCSDSRANSATAYSPYPFWTLWTAADIPTSIHLSAVGYEWLLVDWAPGVNAGDCMFEDWLVEWRAVGGNSSAWDNTTDCFSAGAARQSTSCNITGLVRNTEYEVRIGEKCGDSRTDSPFGYSASPFWTDAVPAGAPTNIRIAAAGEQWLLLNFIPGEAGDCTFSGWLAEWRSVNTTTTTSTTYTTTSSTTTTATTTSTTSTTTSSTTTNTTTVLTKTTNSTTTNTSTTTTTNTSTTTSTTNTSTTVQTQTNTTTTTTNTSTTTTSTTTTTTTTTILETWLHSTLCSRLKGRQSASCNLTGLSRNTEYEVRLRETCTRAVLDSPLAYPLLPLWTLPGEWLVTLPPSEKVSVVVDVLAPSYRCFVVEPQVEDEFSVCHSGADGRLVTVTRTDSPRGWMQWLSVRCVALSLAAAIHIPESRASAPEVMELVEPTINSLVARYELGSSIGSCTCARPKLQVREVGAQYWHTLTGACASWSTRECMVTGLDHNTLYEIRGQVSCAGDVLSSNFTYASNETVKVILAGTPSDVNLLGVGERWMQLNWTSGSESRHCFFLGWNVEWRPVGLSYSTWTNVTECYGTPRDVTECNVTGLERNTEYEVRISESCYDIRADSEFANFSLPLWTLPGYFQVFLGELGVQRGPFIDVQQPPFFCDVVKECCKDEFSFHYTGYMNQMVSITRTDENHGWGQPIQYRCFALSVAPFIPGPPMVPAESPKWLEFHDPHVDFFLVKWDIDAAAGPACHEAFLRLQIQANGTGNWVLIENTCNDLAAPWECWLRDLVPDTLYLGRIQLACANDALSSAWTYVRQPLATTPPCKWTLDSGREYEFECIDRTFGNTPGHGAIGSFLNDTFCNDHGGVLRCPARAPIMCRLAETCAEFQDHCCVATEADCAEYGGRRPCYVKNVPAKVPSLRFAGSRAPATASVDWSAGVYLAYPSLCVFVRWNVEFKLDWQNHYQWQPAKGCLFEDRSIQTCDIDQYAGLESMTDYSVRVQEVCRDRSLSSEWLYFPNATTRPWPAFAPVYATCRDGDDFLPVYWTASWPENCTFVAWSAEVKLLPRPATINALGVFEVAAPGDEWTVGCLAFSRDDTTCKVYNLLSSRYYLVRVQETCTDPHANSEYYEYGSSCRVKSIPADAPQNINASEPSLYTFSVQWEPSLPNACVFRQFHVQVRAAGTSWDLAPTQRGPGAGAGDFECFVAFRNETSCEISVGLGSNVTYDIRVREQCTDPIWDSQWNYAFAAVHTLFPVRAGAPSSLVFFPLPPDLTSITWTSAAPGDCVFDHWYVQLSVAGLPEPNWREHPECRAFTRSFSGCEIIIDGLSANTSYDVRVRESCTDTNANGYFITLTKAVHMRYLAGTPVNISITSPGEEWLLIDWDASLQTGECKFIEWHIQYRPENLGQPKSLNTNAWERFRGCPAEFVRESPVCNVTNLIRNTIYEFRVQELCADPWTKSAYIYTDYPFWTLPGEWLVPVGESMKMSVPVDVLTPPQRCFIADSTYGDEYTFCYSGYWGKQVQVTRTDRPGGWGQDLSIRCSALALEPFTAQPELVSEPPRRLQLVPGTLYTVIAWFTFGGNIGSCSCARQQLQLRAAAVSEWQDIGGNCSDVAYRECTISDLYPDTLYYARMRVKCVERPQQHLTIPVAHDSSWVDADVPIPTFPGCKWSFDSGLKEHFQCADRSFCNATNETCCTSHGGRMRCPPEAPIMCANKYECADGADHCCKTNCSASGGRRGCSPFEEVPAQAPPMSIAASLAPASVALQWSPGLYLTGRSRACTFAGWFVEIAQTNSSGSEIWRHASECLPEFAITTCSITGLESMTDYTVRMIETCEEGELDSDYTMTAPITTRPWPALPPHSVLCGNFTHGAFEAHWSAGLSRDCTFSAWDVETRRLPRLAFTGADGTQYPYVEGRDWQHGCSAHMRDETTCTIRGLRSNHRYDIRIRERCSDPHANSEYRVALWENIDCETVITSRAQAVQDVTCFNAQLYSFEIEWNAGMPNKCIFNQWEVQVQVTGGSWSSSEVVSSCTSLTRDMTNCTVSVGLMSGTQFEARVREVCSDPDISSEWNNSAAITTLFPTRAIAPPATTLVTPAALSITLSWLLGSAVDCVFQAWRVEVSLSNLVQKDWVRMPECEVVSRSTAGCTLVTGILSNTLYDIRIGETCTDSNADSEMRTVAWSVQTLQMRPAGAPGNYAVQAATTSSLELSWDAADANECIFEQWSLQFKKASETSWSSAVLGCSNSGNRALTSCTIGGLLSDTMYSIRLQEICTSSNLNSAAVTWTAQTSPQAASPPHSLVVTSPSPNSFNVSWQAGDLGDCVFSQWDLQIRPRGKGVAGSTLPAWGASQSDCKSVAGSCIIQSLDSNTWHDVRIRAQCNRLDVSSAYALSELHRTRPLQSGGPQNLIASDVTQSSFYLEWEAGELRECIFKTWLVELKPAAVDDWIPVPECSVQDRAADNCTVVGLHSSVSYDIRVQEQCVDSEADSVFLIGNQIAKTLVGVIVDVGPSSTGTASFQVGSFDACSYQQHCCNDEIMACWGTDEVNLAGVGQAAQGWSQDLRLSCIAHATNPALLKRVVAKPAASLIVTDRSVNSISLAWTVDVQPSYLSDCGCPKWNIEARRTGTSAWLPGLGCSNIDYTNRSCTLTELEDNRLHHSTTYEIRVQQTCSSSRLNSPYAELASATLPGCDWSMHSGMDEDFECMDGSFCNATASGDACCRSLGGRKRCPRLAPYMCASRSCAGDHCCSEQPCNATLGGARSCTIALSATSPGPGELQIVWGAAAGGGGSKLAFCSLGWWSVNVRDDNDNNNTGSDDVNVSACIPSIPMESGHSCKLTGLYTDKLYRVEVQEYCSDGSSPREASVVDVLTLPIVAGAPVNTNLSAVTGDSLSIDWQQSSQRGQCDFDSWQVELRPAASSSSTWVPHTACAASIPSASSCTLDGLAANTPYDIQIKEMCTNPTANSPSAQLPYSLWTLPGEWEVYVGRSLAMNIVVDVLHAASRCTVVKECCDDQFSVCHSGSFGRYVTITRVDSPAGWGQKLRLSCTAWSVDGFVPYHPAQATAPRSVWFMDVDRHKVMIQFVIGVAVGSCNCASPHLQLRAQHESQWTSAGGDCADIAKRQCSVPSLQPDTIYHARLQISCSDSTVNSAFVIPEEPKATLPGCKWSTPSGRAVEFQCVDGAFCNMTNATCCDSHGGRQRCPNVVPWMCNSRTCEEDWCCMSDCTLHGGLRPCESTQVPAKTPKILSFYSPTPGTLTLEWTPLLYLSGAVSPCVFDRWRVELAKAAASEDEEHWSFQATCSSHDRRVKSCSILGLSTLTEYNVRVSETCSEDSLNSFPVVSANPVQTLPWPAAAPFDIAVDFSGAGQWLVSWTAGDAGDCILTAWQVDVYVTLMNESIILAQSSTHPATAGSSNSATVSGLHWSMTYEIQVVQRCSDSRADSRAGKSPLFRWLSSTTWDTWVDSSSSNLAETNVLSAPELCSAVDPCCDYEFSACYSPRRSQSVIVTRMDSLDGLAGWNQGFWIRCMSSLSDSYMQVQTSTPKSLRLRSLQQPNLILAQYLFETGIGSCMCARPRLEVKAEEDGEWTLVGGVCRNMTSRQCLVKSLRPDTRYFGRIQIACSNEVASSNFSDAPLSIVTHPGCKWSTDSGREMEFECLDGSFCNMTNATCCNDHGGRLRCPASQPVMCQQDNDCADGQDHCCATDCSEHGGHRACTYFEVPAKVPIINSAASMSPASLTTTWSASEYQLARSSGCVFSYWSLELARMHSWGRGPWAQAPCSLSERRITTCEANGLESEALYDVRLAEACTDSSVFLRSDYETRFSILTLPIPALAPIFTTCLNVTEESFKVIWEAGLPKDCIFRSWQLELKLLPRLEQYNSQTSYLEPFAEGTDWTPNFTHTCALDTREDMESCNISDLLSNRGYLTRIREQCVDARTNSDYSESSSICYTQAVQAELPEVALDGTPEAYSFHVRWVPGHPRACIFVAWEVQVNSSELPRGNACTITDRKNTTCKVSVGLGSDTRYDIRMRETCTDPAFFSEWATIPYPGISTRLPHRAGSVTSLKASLQTPTKVTVAWSAGVPNECVFTGWLAELRNDGIGHELECTSTSREQTSCEIDSSLLRIDLWYTATVREKCTDPSADSMNVTLQSAARVLAFLVGHSRVTLDDMGQEFLSISWTEATGSSLCSLHVWQVAFRPLGTQEWSFACLGEHSDYMLECNITGLQPSTGYEIEVRQACNQPLSNAVKLTSSFPFWTLPGEWKTYVGTSAVMTKTVDVQTPPHRCFVEKECCSDRFSVCITGVETTLVAVTRTDFPVGWGQELHLRCVGLSAAPFVTFNETRAKPPSMFQVVDPTVSSIAAQFKLEDDLGTCDCVSLDLQVRSEAPNVSDWQSVSTCTSMATRRCVIEGLSPATLYNSRLRLACSNPNLNSSWRYAQLKTATPVGQAVGSLMFTNVASSLLASGGRRLMSSSPFQTRVAAVLAGVCNVPPTSLAIDILEQNRTSDDADASVLVQYTVAAAKLLVDEGSDDPSSQAAAVVARLDAAAPTLCSQLQTALGAGVQVSIVDPPRLEIRESGFPACGIPPAVQHASPEWIASDCSGRTWSDEPCAPLCPAGFFAEGEYRCSAMGEWTGTPRCVREWLSGPWSNCNVTCGPGVQQRSVTCDIPEGCHVNRPAQVQACYATESCVWQAHEWGPCSPACGQSYKTRIVACSSGHDEDCAMQAPINATVCQDYSACYWQTSAWDSCSSQCGMGTQARTVWCPSQDASHCQGDAPEAVVLCRNSTGCSWQVSEWSFCSNSCGSGFAIRDVICPSGVDADCGDGKPWYAQHCYETSGCAWSMTPWSSCSANSTCGAGVQNRTVTCPTGQAADCSMERPADERACFVSSGCTWSVSDWGQCDNRCGLGYRSRQVVCSSGRDSDCSSGDRPKSQNPCYSSEECVWQVGEWGSCSDACGYGRRERTVQCSSGNPTGCSESQPQASEQCPSISTCAWHVTEWSQCSNSCGDGMSARIASCPSGRDADCPGNKPDESKLCADTAGCGWNVGSWSACNSTCGSGWQIRSIECPVGAMNCTLPGPAQHQPCYATSGCTWVTGAWRPCGSTCGQGVRTREVTCSSGVDSDCPSTKPTEEESCLGTAGCEWLVSAWSSCNTSCGQGTRERIVVCPTGVQAHCSSTRPPEAEVCHNTSGCSWNIGQWSACSSTCGPGLSVRSVACETGNDSDCPAIMPVNSTACYSKEACRWIVGLWSACSTECGNGVQSRKVWCPSGHSGDCPGSGPAAQQSCRETSGCVWSVSTWSNCSAACVSGVRSRDVRCGNLSDADCGHVERPLDRQTCDGHEGACAWQVGNWSSCSVTTCNGVGTQSRPVSCPSAVPSNCPTIRPDAVRSCESSAPCSWHAGNWSTCEAECGWGEQQRDISCPGGNEAKCPGDKPESSKRCYSDAGCGWDAGSWSACTSSCGKGTQTREVVCSTVHCRGTGPESARACYSTQTCTWLVGEWGSCTVDCGDGLQNRTVRCASGREDDCSGQDRPADQRECHRTEACTWLTSGWSLCSATCGTGTQQRTASCSGSLESDCDASLRPAAVRSCSETLGCTWQTSPWSECSVLCGEGHQTRDVWCPGDQAGDCAARRPDAERSCHNLDGCRWSTSEWSECDRKCAAGRQHRSVTCESDEPERCPLPGPATWQSCLETHGCEWVAQEWSDCSNGCGSGTRERTVYCAVSGRCEDARPADAEECHGSVECQWHASEWSSCSNPSCEPQMRELTCSSGQSADCAAEAVPAAARACTVPSCTASAPGSTLNFTLSLLLDSAPTEHVVHLMIESARAAVAQVLSVSPDLVHVSIRQEGDVQDFGSDNARRLGVTLKLEVSILNAGLGVQKLLTSDARHSAFASALHEELEDRNLDLGDLDLRVDVSRNPEKSRESPTVGGNESTGGQLVIIAVLLALLLLCSAALCCVCLWRSRSRSSKRKQLRVAQDPDSPKKARAEPTVTSSPVTKLDHSDEAYGHHWSPKAQPPILHSPVSKLDKSGESADQNWSPSQRSPASNLDHSSQSADHNWSFPWDDDCDSQPSFELMAPPRQPPRTRASRGDRSWTRME